jgi:tight adherence protein B
MRVRSELETRQGWVANAAKLAVAGPWMLLALLSFRSTSIQAYQQPAGVLVLVVGAGVSVVAYRVMVRMGRLPEDERVLR